MAHHSTRSRTEDVRLAAVVGTEGKRGVQERGFGAGRKQHIAAPGGHTSQRYVPISIQKLSPMKSSRGYANRQRISVAGIFKKRNKGGRRDKKNYTPKAKVPELIEALEDGVEEARWTINNNSHNTFEQVHARFSQRIKALEKDNKEFIDKMSYKVSLLSAPLAEERLETRVRRNGEQTVEVVEIGNRVTAFMTLVDKEDENLTDLWRQWDELQEEYIKLGVEVFGSQKFGESAAPYGDLPGGYRRDTEDWVIEHEAMVEEINDEIEGIGVKILHKMKTTEKQLDVAAKKEQARLLQSIME